jgi:hypothetical protein
VARRYHRGRKNRFYIFPFYGAGATRPANPKSTCITVPLQFNVLLAFMGAQVMQTALNLRLHPNGGT